MKLQVNTINHITATVDIDNQLIANEIQFEISGNKATPAQANLITQEFINRHGIKVRYASGTLIHFIIPDSALDEFETFKR